MAIPKPFSNAIIILLLIIPVLLSGQPAPLDPNFGVAGIVNFQYDFGSLLNDTKLLPDGKILIAGGGTNGSYLARFAPDGSVDNTFGVGGVSQIFIENVSPHAALAIQTDNKIISVGQVIDVASPFQFRLFGAVRFHPDGSLDSTFGQAGVSKVQIGSYAVPNIVTLQPDGKILALGQANIGSGLRFAWARFHPDGKIDSTFSDNGVTTFPTSGAGLPTCIAVLPDGKILSGGTEVGSNPGAKFLMCRLHPNGVVDSTFGVNGKFDYWFGDYFEVISDMQVLPNGKILAGGWVGPTTDGSFALIRLNANGSLDPTFGTNGLVKIKLNMENSISAIDVLSDGKIVFSGTGFDNFGMNPNPPYETFVIRLNPNGTLDQSFNGTGIGTITTGDAAGSGEQIIQPDGKILIGGFYYPVGGQASQIMLARVLNAGVNGTSAPIPVKDCSVAPNPTNGLAFLHFALERPVPIGIKIYDLLGRCVQTISEPKNFPAGENTIQLDISQLPSGHYEVLLESPIGATTVQLVR